MNAVSLDCRLPNAPSAWAPKGGSGAFAELPDRPRQRAPVTCEIDAAKHDVSSDESSASVSAEMSLGAADPNRSVGES